MKRIIMSRNAKTIVETLCSIKPKEKVLLLCDNTTFLICKVLASAIYSIKAEPIIMIITPRKYHGEELPLPVAEAMKSANVLIAPTKYNVAHTKARFAAQKAGVRIMTLTDVNEDLLLNRGWEVDFCSLKPRIEKLREMFSNTEEAILLSSEGTNFKVSLKGRQGRALTGFTNNEDISSGYGLEASIAPLEGTGEGIIVCNSSIPGVGLIKEPVSMTFEKGNLVKIEGGIEAKKFRDLLESKDDPNVYSIAELGIGMNPNCETENSALSDEAVYGTVHVAVGTNAYIGGNVIASGHYDTVISNVHLKFDGVTVVKDGEVYA